MTKKYKTLNKYISVSGFIKLLQFPDWYIKLAPEQTKIQNAAEKLNEAKRRKLVYEVYRLFEDQLSANDIALGTEAGIWDTQRKPVDQIIIHHTSGTPGMTKNLLSAIELVRLYAPHYLNPTDINDKHIIGKPISSGHIRDGKQVFWPYHWIVRQNGSAERLLEDNEIGWQSGNWETNCRSVAIVLDNDYENKTPSSIELEAIAGIIKDNYSNITKQNILGHREVNPKTACPSNLFLSTDGWKEKLLNLL